MAKILIGRTLDQSTDSVTVKQGDPGSDEWPVGDVFRLVPDKFDTIELGYTGSNLTSVVYKQGGAGGSVVATLTLAYTGDRLDSVTRT